MIHAFARVHMFFLIELHDLSRPTLSLPQRGGTHNKKTNSHSFRIDCAGSIRPGCHPQPCRAHEPEALAACAGLLAALMHSLPLSPQVMSCHLCGHCTYAISNHMRIACALHAQCKKKKNARSMRIEDYVHAQTRIVCAGNKQFLCSLPAEKRVCFSPAGGSDQEACRPADDIRAPNCCQSTPLVKS